MRIPISIIFLFALWMQSVVWAEETTPDQTQEAGDRATPRPPRKTFNGLKIKDKTVLPTTINSAPASAGMVLAADGNGGAVFTSDVSGSSSTFTGPLAGDVTGTQSATVIAPGAVTASKLDPGIGIWPATGNDVSRPTGRVIVQGTTLDTSTFTGLGFQYSSATNEGAIIASFNDSFSFITFYTKIAAGQPVTQRMIIDRGGNVGIGTSTPLAKLDVRGNIAFGVSGEFQVPAVEENLRIVRGVVSGGAGLLAGAGFTITKGAAGSGQYTITFNTPFSGPPTVTATADLDGRVISTVGVTSTTANFQVSVVGGGHTDAAFHVIAIGPR